MPKHRAHINRARIDSLCKDLDSCHGPGAGIGVAVDGEIVYREGFGLTNIEVPLVITPSTRMRIYSVTKHITCLAFLLLCEEGRANIDDVIGKHLHGLHPDVRGITMLQLMSNTGGLLDITDVRWRLGSPHNTFSIAEVPKVYAKLGGTNFPPGTRWCYNNGGFQLVSAAVEAIAREPLAEVFRRRIFEPIGMYDSLLRPLDTDFVSNSASMHMGSKGEFRKIFLPGELSGEGGVVSTVDDMLRWLIHMDNPAVGTADTWALLRRPVAVWSGGSTGYGMGLFVTPYRGVETIGHSGGGLGANAQMLRVPAAGLNLVVIVNREDVSASDLACRILSECLPDLEDAKVPVGDTIAQGLYRSGASGRLVRLYGESREQRVSMNWGWGYRFQQERGGILRPAPGLDMCPWEIQLVGDYVHPSAIRLNECGAIDMFDLIVPPARTDETAIDGTYRSQVTGIEITVVGQGKNTRMESRSRFGSAVHGLRCVGTDLWVFEPEWSHLPWRGVLAFDAKRERLNWMTERTWSLEFTRVT